MNTMDSYLDAIDRSGTKPGGANSWGPMDYYLARFQGTTKPDCLRVAAIYLEAAYLNARGEKVHVDHILPLRPADGQFCGLHVHANLQIIPAADNLRKGNRP